MQSAIQLTDNTLRRHAERVHKGASSALALLDWLEIEGFQPVSVKILPERKPVVFIAQHVKCQWLKAKHGAYVHVRRASGLNTWRCDMLGCRLEWIEGGH